MHAHKTWSKEELAHAAAVLEKAEAHKHPHVRLLEDLHLGAMVLMLSLLAAGLTILMMPLLLLANPLLTIPLMLLLGICAGTLYHDSSLLAFGILAMISFCVVFIIMEQLHLQESLVTAFAYLIGMIAAHSERRYHEFA